MKKFMVIGGIAVVAIVVVVVVVLGNLNSIIKKGVETAGPKILQAPVTLAKADISILSGTGDLTSLTIGNPEGFNTEYAFQLGQVKIDVDTGSVASEKIHVKNITIDAPQIIFEGAFGGKNNLAQLQANAESFTGAGGKEPAVEEKKTQDSSGGKKIQIDLLTIKNGSVSVSMGMLQGKKLTVQLPPIELRDIGKDKDASISDALKKVLGAINKAVIPAIQSNLGNISGELKKTGETLQKEMEKGLGGFKGLLGK